MLQSNIATAPAANFVSGRTATFARIYDEARKIEFNPNWNNGTGYMDHAVAGLNAPLLANGEVIACVTPSPNDRKLVIVGTPLGNVVVFQRYTDREDIFAWCATMQFRRAMIPMIPAMPDAEDIEMLLGSDVVANIGLKMQAAMDTPNPSVRQVSLCQAIRSYLVKPEQQ
jgi:hypothetical protein